MKRVLLVCAIVGSGMTGLAAEDGWDVTAGAGVYRSAVYEGADEGYVATVPTVEVGYTTGAFSLSLSLLDGFRASYFAEAAGILWEASVNTGAERKSDGYSTLFGTKEHSRSTSRLLTGTPDVQEIVSTDLTLGFLTPVGLVGAVGGYRPTTCDDVMYHGFLTSAFYLLPLPVGERATLTAIASVEAMDRRYAEAWYGVSGDAANLEEFDAAAGLRATQFVLEAALDVTERFGVSLLAGETVLLGDAAESPYTQQRFQTTVLLRGFYQFL